MHTQLLSVVLACALGGSVGAVCGAEAATYFAHGKFLWALAGAFFGGLLAYVTNDYRHFGAGIARAYRRTIDWRPYAPYWRAYIAQWLGMSAVVVTALIAFIGVMTLFDGIDGRQDYGFSAKAFLLMFSICEAVIAVLMVPSMLGRKPDSSEEEYTEKLTEEEENGLRLLRRGNPFSVAAYVMYAPWFVIKKVPAIRKAVAVWSAKNLPLLGEFAKQAFVYVHTEERTICFVGGTLGALGGIYFGSDLLGHVVGATLAYALTGGALGALAGWVSRELVAIRWLKLVPVKAK
jgi:hypothetical protein